MKEFCEFKYDDENDIVFLTWKKESKNLTDQKFIDIQNAYTEVIIDNKAKNTIVDIRDFKFAIRPSVQEKIAKTYYKRSIAAGLKKVAVINSKELIAQISAEQMMEEEEAAPFITQYFDDLASAISWLKSS